MIFFSIIGTQINVWPSCFCINLHVALKEADKFFHISFLETDSVSIGNFL